MRVLLVSIIIFILTVAIPGKAMAAMTEPEIETYDCLAAYMDTKVDIWNAGVVGFAVPGLPQIKRGAILQGSVQIGLEIGALFFLLQKTEVTADGDTFSTLTVNWVALVLLAANHFYSAYDNVRWALGENVELRMKYHVDQIVIGVAF